MELLQSLFVIGSLWFWVIVAAEFCFLIYCLEYEKYYAAPITLVVFVLAVLFLGNNFRDVVGWICDNPTMTAVYLASYVGVGAIWALSKWWLFVHDTLDKNRDIKRGWLANWKTQVRNLEILIKDTESKINNQQKYIEQNTNNAGVVKQAENEIAKLTLLLKNTVDQRQIWAQSGGNMTALLLPIWKQYEVEYIGHDWFGRRMNIAKPDHLRYKGRIIAWGGYWPPSMVWTILNDPLRRIGNWIYRMLGSTLKRISDSAWKNEDDVV